MLAVNDCNKIKTVLEAIHESIAKDTKTFMNCYMNLDKYKDGDEADLNQLVEDIWFGLFNDAVSQAAREYLADYHAKKEAV